MPRSHRYESREGPEGGEPRTSGLLELAGAAFRGEYILPQVADRLVEAQRRVEAGRPQLRAVLTYGEVIAFFRGSRAQAPPNTVPVVLRHRQGRGYLVQAFWWERGGRPPRRRADAGPELVCRAEELDEELTEMFDGRDTIIFAGREG